MNEIAQPTYIQSELKKFNINVAEIEKVKEKYSSLAIKDIDDKSGYLAVRTARLDVKGMRVAVDKTRKELNQSALFFQRAVNSHAAELTKPLEELECNLESKEDAYEAEKERIKQEKEEAEQLKLQARIAEISKYGFSFDGQQYVLLLSAPHPDISGNNIQIGLPELKSYDDGIFSAFINKIKITYQSEQNYHAEVKAQEEAEQSRIKAEQEAESARAEELRLAEIKCAEEKRAAELAQIEEERKIIAGQQQKIRLEQEAERQRLQTIADEQAAREAAIKAAQEKLEAEKRAIEAAKQREVDEWVRQQHLEIACQAAADKAAQEERERIERERLQQIQEQEKAAAELARQEALKPDKEKLEELAKFFSGMVLPVVGTKDAEKIISTARLMLNDIASYIESEIKNFN